MFQCDPCIMISFITICDRSFLRKMSLSDDERNLRSGFQQFAEQFQQLAIFKSLKEKQIQWKSGIPG